MNWDDIFKEVEKMKFAPDQLKSNWYVGYNQCQFDIMGLLRKLKQIDIAETTHSRGSSS